MFRKALIATTLAIATLSAGSAIAGETGTVATDGYKSNFHLAANRNEYHRCAKFSIAVYNACLEQAGGNSNKVRSCRSHYQGNLQRCQALNN
jgi:hypothetical protein